MRCLVALAGALALAGCKDRTERDSSPAAAAIGEAAPRDAPAPDGPPVDALTDRDRRAARLARYLELLSIDYWTFDLLARFPGFPAGGVFETGHYAWTSQVWLNLETLRSELAEIRAAASAAPRRAVDDAVRAYLAVSDRWLPSLLELWTYYQTSRFVDDEFARARREADGVATALGELAAVRTAMREQIYDAWRELSGEHADSPRAIVGRAWEACFRYQDLLFARPDPDQVAATVSACRRSIQTVTALPKAIRDTFDDELRAVAIEIGDDQARRWRSDYFLRGLARLTAAYLALWPTLPTRPLAPAAPPVDAAAPPVDAAPPPVDAR